MKKLYLLMATVMFAATSFALNFTPVSGLQLKPEAKQKMQQTFEQGQKGILPEGEVLGTRSFTDAKGRVWQAEFVNTGMMIDFFTFGDEKPTIYDIPFYMVYTFCATYGEDGYATDVYQAYLNWPAYYAFTEEGAEPKEGDEKILTIQDLISTEYTTFEAFEYGSYGMNESGNWCMFNPEWLGVIGLFNSTEGYIAEGSTLQISNYVKDTSSIALKWAGQWYIEGAATNSGSFALNYEGETFITGFEEMTFYGEEFKDLHIYDCGEMNNDTEIGSYYELEFDPVKHYAVYAVSDVWEIIHDAVPARQAFLNYLGADPTNVPSTDYTYFLASAYADLNSTDCTGEYTIQEFLLGDEIGWYDNVPLPGTIMCGGYIAPYSQVDGAVLYYRGQSYTPDPGSVLTISGSSTFKGIDRYTNAWDVKFKKTYFHNDPNDHNKFVELNSGVSRLFGDKSANLITKSNGQVNVTAAEDGVIAVYSTTGALVKTVKAVAGQEVSIELGNGLYIVKVGKSAAKVIL